MLYVRNVFFGCFLAVVPFLVGVAAAQQCTGCDLCDACQNPAHPQYDPSKVCNEDRCLELSMELYTSCGLGCLFEKSWTWPEGHCIPDPALCASSSSSSSAENCKNCATCSFLCPKKECQSLGPCVWSFPNKCDPDPASCPPPSDCGDGSVDPGEECGEPTLTCPSGQQCNIVTCLCYTCGDGTLDPGEQCEVGIACPNATDQCNPLSCQCGPCDMENCGSCGDDPARGDDPDGLCEERECMARGPCFYRRYTLSAEGTCTLEESVCQGVIPNACFDCKECGVGWWNICDKTECEKSLGLDQYCIFTPRPILGFFGAGLCAPDVSECVPP